MKKLIILAILFGGCVTATEPTPSEHTYKGTGVLVAENGYRSPSRETILSFNDSTGVLSMRDADGEFTDVLQNVTYRNGLISAYIIGAENSDGQITLHDKKGVIQDSFKIGTTLRVLNLQSK